MIVVADTSPLNYLILIEQIEVIEVLYKRVAIPAAVHREMVSPGAPKQVRKWAAIPPGWLEVHPSASSSIVLSERLDAGEREAIGLALFLKSPVLIIDETAGRKEAQRIGLRVIGTLGILRDAHAAGLLNLNNSIQRLQATNFHIAAKTLAELLPEN
jgi:predicted nucleic acid-binding protein